jgi:phosphotransferase system  glucose/maltose/N-acetylglucosamine-specific IIC component
LFSEYLIQKDKELSIKLWIFHNILNILFSILIAISFSKRNADK